MYFQKANLVLKGRIRFRSLPFISLLLISAEDETITCPSMSMSSAKLSLSEKRIEKESGNDWKSNREPMLRSIMLSSPGKVMDGFRNGGLENITSRFAKLFVEASERSAPCSTFPAWNPLIIPLKIRGATPCMQLIIPRLAHKFTRTRNRVSSVALYLLIGWPWRNVGSSSQDFIMKAGQILGNPAHGNEKLEAKKWEQWLERLFEEERDLKLFSQTNSDKEAHSHPLTCKPKCNTPWKVVE